MNMNSNTNLLLHLTETVAFGYLGYAMHNRINEIERTHSIHLDKLYAAIADMRQQFSMVERENLVLKRKVKKLQKMFWTYNMGGDTSLDYVPAFLDNTVMITDIPTDVSVDDLPDIGYDSDPDPDLLMELEPDSPATDSTIVTEPDSLTTELESTTTESIIVTEPDSQTTELESPTTESIIVTEPDSQTTELESPTTESTIVTEPEIARVKETPIITEVQPPPVQTPVQIIKNGTIWNPNTGKYTKITSKAGSILYETYQKSKTNKK